MSGRRPGNAALPALPLLFLLLTAPGAAQPPTPASGIRPRMEQALALLAAGEAERAIPLLLSIVDEAPHHGPARLQLGALAVERGEWAVAVGHLRAAAAAGTPAAPEGAVPPQRPGLAWALLADALDEAGRLAEALEAGAEALRFAPDYLPALLRRAEVARRLAANATGIEAADRVSRLETALEAARKARDLAPARPGPWTALALAARDAALPELARCAAGRAAELAPDDPRAWFLLARTAADSDPEAALAAAERALAAGLDREPALRMTLGRLHAFRMEMDASLAAYAEALRLDPAAAGEMASFALDALAAGEDAELLALLRERAASRPEARNARFALAKADLRAGRIETALAELTRLAAERPGHAAVLTTLHAALRQAGDREGAEAALARLEAAGAAADAVWQRADKAERERRLAEAAASRGDFAEAARRFEALAANPGAPSDRAGLGRALHSLGRPAQALAAFRRALDARPFDPAILLPAAEAARLAGAAAEADRHAARASLAAADCDRIPGSGDSGAAR